MRHLFSGSSGYTCLLSSLWHRLNISWHLPLHSDAVFLMLKIEIFFFCPMCFWLCHVSAVWTWPSWNPSPLVVIFKTEISNSDCVIVLWGLNELIYIKYLEHCWVPRKQYLSFSCYYYYYGFIKVGKMRDWVWDIASRIMEKNIISL